MDISIIVTCYNEEKNIESCLKSLVSQNYELGKFEIIVSDGNSTDLTQQIVKDFSSKFVNVKLVVESKKGTAAGRNKGVRAAAYDYVAFTDADCEAPAGWLELLARNYERIKKDFNKLAGVGGKNISPLNSGNFQQAIELAMDSYLGSFRSIQGRQFQRAAFVDSLSTSNALYDKSKIAEVGFFDESLLSEAEDADINFRLYSKGYKFFFSPESFVWHKMRLTPLLWLKNMFRYGKGRARLLKRYKDMRNLSFIIPVCFLFLMLAIPLGLVFHFCLLPLLYFPAIFLFSLVRCAKKGKWFLTLSVTAVYIIQHFAYSVGETYGLFNPRVK